MLRYLIPFFIFAGLVLLFVFGLHNDPRIVPSPFIDKPVPLFTAPALKDTSVTLSSADLKGEVALLNVWATWCLPCRQEHPLLVELARDQEIKIYGLNYKDVREDAIAWLAQLGDPYAEVFFDATGTAGIDLGVYGVPETFVLDRDGIIRYKHIGPLSKEAITDIVLPFVEELQQ